MHRRHCLATDEHVGPLADLDAEFLLVVNPDGTQHHYARVNGEMMPLAPIHNPAYAAESDPMETLAAQQLKQ